LCEIQHSPALLLNVRRGNRAMRRATSPRRRRSASSSRLKSRGEALEEANGDLAALVRGQAEPSAVPDAQVDPAADELPVA
jgi:hypothetical protein